MRPPVRAAILVVALAGALSSCGPLDKSHWATGHFSGNKTIAITLGYGGNADSLAASVYADVADGTAGTVEVTGVQHWRCQGQFRTHHSESGTFPWDIENLPGFVPPTTTDDPVLNFFVPKGSYTVTVRIPAVHAELKASATLERGSGPNPQTLLYFHDPGCALIADTTAEQRALITQYLDGMQLTARRLSKPDLRAFVDQARQENALANQSTDPVVVQSSYARIARILVSLGDVARADFPDPPRDIMQAISETMPLLAQSGLP
jgi:hypothetical protein